ncbi:glutaredoxin family protein [Thermophilibacter immobilis]|jgi:glutaredoxin|uniref:Glutathione S-transferase N-terminal domain-containing protein n=1 Tax=Thermophilibacter immobilis TaxID=2779519 RepID=A0A7S7M8E7_9ACTN|nr:glutaredoxin domain-containing protein [Thermophilibacter immobilis]QOY60642.1 glutathione S-transferase N-terminal domain-containing protein [Thermophilibacter immobilis]
MSEKNLVLYMKPSCPYCRRVMSYMEKSHIELPERDISRDPSAREELVRVGGKGQVPCLFIDGEPLYESADIIGYLAAHEA